MTNADFPYDSPLFEQMQKNLERRRHREYLRRLTPEQKIARQTWVDAIEAEEKSLSGSKPKRPAPAMTAEDRTILEALADESPMALTQPDLTLVTRLPQQKIGERLRWLESKGLVKRPEGTRRKGHAITLAGLSAIGRAGDAPY